MTIVKRLRNAYGVDRIPFLSVPFVRFKNKTFRGRNTHRACLCFTRRRRRPLNDLPLCALETAGIHLLCRTCRIYLQLHRANGRARQTRRPQTDSVFSVLGAGVENQKPLADKTVRLLRTAFAVSTRSGGARGGADWTFARGPAQ